MHRFLTIFVLVSLLRLTTSTLTMENPHHIALYGPTNEIIIAYNHAQLSGTIKELLSDIDIDTLPTNTDGVPRLPMHNLDRCLPLIKPYFELSSSDKSDLLRSHLQANLNEHLYEIINAFNYLDIESVYTPALETLAERMVKKDQLYSCLKDAKGSYHLPLAIDMQYHLAHEMLSRLDHTKGSLLLNFMIFKNGKIPFKVLPRLYKRLNFNERNDCPFYNGIELFFNADDTLFASTRDTIVKIWDGKKEKIVSPTIADQTRWMKPKNISPNGSMRACAHGRTIKIKDTATKTCLYKLKSHTDTVTTACFTPDSSLLASGSDDGTIKLWDLTTGTLVQTIHHSRPVKSLHFNGDGTLLVSTCKEEVLKSNYPPFQGDSLKIWSLSNKTLVLRHRFNNLDPSINSIGFTTNGLLICAKSRGSTHYNNNEFSLQLCDLKSGPFIATLNDHGWFEDSVCFNAAGTLLALISVHERLPFYPPLKNIKIFALADAAINQLFKEKKLSRSSWHSSIILHIADTRNSLLKNILGSIKF